MTLLAPLLASFAALAAIPIAIHLINRRRFRVVPWAAMQFLLATMRTNARRLHLRDLIILALRVLALVFLAFALARPSLAPGGVIPGLSGETATALIIDRSLSQRAREAGTATRYDTARAVSHEAVTLLPTGAAVGLIALTDQATPVIATASHDLVQVHAAIDRLGAASNGAGNSSGNSGADLAAGLMAAADLLERSPASGREIILVSDCPAAAFGDRERASLAAAAGRLARMSPAPRLFIVANANEQARHANLALDPPHLRDPLAVTDAVCEVVSTLRGFGSGDDDASKDLRVDCFVAAPGEELRKVGSAAVPGLRGAAEIRIPVRFRVGGQHRIELRVDAAGRGDALDEDSLSRAVFDVIDQAQVLIVDGRYDAAAPLRGAAGFLAAALAPDDPDAATRSPLRCEIVSVQGLSGRRLKDYRCIVLAGVGELPTASARALTAYVREEGGGLVLFPEANATPWNASLSEVLPARLSPQRTLPMPTSIAVTQGRLDHPIAAYFRSDELAPYLGRPRFSEISALTLQAGSTAAAVSATAPPAAAPALSEGDRISVVLTSSDDAVLCAERRAGRGRCVLFAFAADRSGSDLPLHPAYLPLMLRGVQTAMLGDAIPSTLRVGTRAVLALAPGSDRPAAGASESPPDAVLHAPDGARRLVELLPSDRPGAGPIARLSALDQLGFYRLDLPDGSSRHLASAPPPEESDLTLLPLRDLPRFLPGVTTLTATPATLRQTMSAGRVGIELWPYLLALAAACLAAETILVLRWGPRSAAPTGLGQRAVAAAGAAAGASVGSAGAR